MKLRKKLEIAMDLMREYHDIFQCPICKTKIDIQEPNSLICWNNHCFNLSKRGSVHFLLDTLQSDYDKTMLESRKIICQSGFFAPLLDKILQLVQEELPTQSKKEIRILDLGTGEGSHLAEIIERLQKSTSSSCLGVGMDISKAGIDLAARDYTGLIWCVGDLVRSPFQSSSFDLILNILSPSNYEEFLRIADDEALLLKVIPTSEYLRELRELFYEGKEKKEYSNERVQELFAENLQVIRHEKVSYRAKLSSENWQHLIQMTPLSWGVSPEKLEKAFQLPANEVTVGFEILLGKRK